jgi:hypothetical protein
MGTLIEPVPVTGFAANFSPVPRTAPPPLGREIEGAVSFCSPSLRLVILSDASMVGPSTRSRDPNHSKMNSHPANPLPQRRQAWQPEAKAFHEKNRSTNSVDEPNLKSAPHRAMFQ